MAITKIRFSEAALEYAAHLKARGLEENTVKAKVSALNKGVVVWENPYVSSIGNGFIDRLFRAADWSPSTQNMYLGFYREFFGWCRHNQYMDLQTEPTFGWRSIRVPKVKRLRVPVDEFYPLMDACYHPRDRFAIAVGLFNLLRGSEVASLKIKDLNMSTLSLDIYRHKGKEADVMPVSEEFREEALEWLNWYRWDQDGLDPEWYLVPAKGPDPWLTSQNKRSDVLATLRPTKMMSHPYWSAQYALKQLGYPTRGEGEHTLRRSGARAYFDRLRADGVDNALLQTAAMLGHKDIKDTQHYIGLEIGREERNKAIAGKRMYPEINRDQKGLHVVREMNQHG